MKIPMPLLIVLLVTVFALGTVYEYSKQEYNSIKFIWNDDEESIPADGSLISFIGVSYITPFLLILKQMI